MFVVYRPGDGDQQKWTFKPRKLKSQEAEGIEKRTGWTYQEFVLKLQQGSTLARRALLWTFLRRTHHTIRFEDIDFSLDELEVSMDKGELAELRKSLEKFEFDDEATRRMALAQVDQQMEEAEEDPDGPKAS